MQKFLTENVLTLLQQVDGNLQDQTKTLETLQQNLNIVFKNIVSDRHDFINSQRKMLLTATSKVQAFSQLQGQELEAISEREEKLRQTELQFGARFREAKKKIDGLLSSLFSEYETYSGLVNKTADANSRNLESASSRNDAMMSLMQTAVNQAIDSSKDFSFKSENKEKLVHMELNQKLTDGMKSNKAVDKHLDVVESQTKQFIGERQGAWELHYNSQEIQLRKKADTNKELLQKHQAESQVSFPTMIDTSFVMLIHFVVYGQYCFNSNCFRTFIPKCGQHPIPWNLCLRIIVRAIIKRQEKDSRIFKANARCLVPSVNYCPQSCMLATRTLPTISSVLQTVRRNNSYNSY